MLVKLYVLVAKRPLDIVVYGLGSVEGVSKQPQTHEEMLAWLKALGFKTPEWTRHCKSADELVAAIDDLDKLRKKFPYETDGAVMSRDVARRARRRIASMRAATSSGWQGLVIHSSAPRCSARTRN